MERPSTRRLAVLLVVVTVALAGCSGGGGGDSGATTETTATTAATTDGDGETTTEATTTGATTTTAATTATTAATTTTKAATTTPGGGGGVPLQQHVAGLREAGSYTVELSIENAQDMGTVSVTQRTDLSTNEQYAVIESDRGTFEFYRPPNADTAYRYTGGQAREIPPEQAFFFNISNVDETTNDGVLTTATEGGSGRTPLGPATKYVVRSVENLPEGALDQYDRVENVNFTVWVDEDTGILAKYDYRVTVVKDGQQRTIAISYEISNLGSTTVEKPDWVPE